MQDLAEIGFSADTRDLEKAADALDDLTPAAAKAETASDRLEKKLNELGKSGGIVGKGVSSLGRQLLGLGGIMAGVFSVAKYRDLADGWSDINSRVGLAVGNMDLAASTLDRLGQVARGTYSSLTATAEGFIANSRALGEMGKSTQEILDYTEALNNALVVSGARGDRFRQVQDALTKAMSTGSLRGMELAAVLNHGGRITQLLTEHFNTNTGGLMKLASQGKITADVINGVLVNAMETLAEEAGDMPATIEDGFQLIGNAIFRLVGTFDQLTGVSSTVASALIAVSNVIEFAADNIDRLITYGQTAAVIFGVVYYKAIWGAIAATWAFVGGLKGLAAALLRTGIGALIVALGEIVHQLFQARDASENWGEAFAKVGKRIEFALDGIRFTFYGVTETVKSYWFGMLASILEQTEKTFGTILRWFGVSAETMGSAIADMRKQSEGWAEIAGQSFGIAKEQFASAFASFKEGSETIEETTNNIVDMGNAAEGAGKKLTELQRIAEEIGKLSEPFNQAKTAFDAATTALDNGIISAEKYAEMIERIEAAFMRAGGTIAQWAEITKRELTDVEKSIQDLTEKALVGLGDAFFDLLATGKSSFRELASSIIKDIARIAWQLLVVKPLMDAIFNPGSGGGGGGFFGGIGKLFGFAKGGAFGSGISGHSNSIVDRPTLFAFASGAGVMGEAGPEAIMPLRRGPDGSLGVQMYGGGRDGGNAGVQVTYAPSYTVEAGATQEAVAELRKVQDEDRRNFQANVQEAVSELRARGSDI